MSDYTRAEELVEFGDLVYGAARYSRRDKLSHSDLKRAAEAIVDAAIKAAAAVYGDKASACVKAERGERARRGRLAAATGAFEALGPETDPKRVAYAFRLDAHAAARPRVCSPAYALAADAARHAVKAAIVELGR